MMIRVVDDETVEYSDPETGWVCRQNGCGEMVLIAPKGVEIEDGVWLLSERQRLALFMALVVLSDGCDKMLGKFGGDEVSDGTADD